MWLKTLKITLFFIPIYQDEFWGSNAKVCVTYPINANVAIIISDSQQKYVMLKAMRRSGGISKRLLMKNLKSKVYVSFLIGLYSTRFRDVGVSKKWREGGTQLPSQSPPNILVLKIWVGL